MSTMTQLMTADELWRMPHDNFRYELVQGELKQMSPSGYEHGAVVVNLTSPLDRHVKAHGIGVVSGAETGFLIARDPDTVRAPDIALVRRERIPASGLPRSYFPGAPDLAVEVVSPGDTVYEVDEKIMEWLAAGSLAVWIVNPRRRTVAIHRVDGTVTTLRESDELDGQQVVPSFRLSVAEIFG